MKSFMKYLTGSNANIPLVDGVMINRSTQTEQII